MRKLATLALTASMAIGSLFAVAAPASATPIAPAAVTQSSDVVQVRDERWRHHRNERRSWRHDRREFRHGRGDWRRDRWHNRREWHRQHRRNGVIIRL